MSAKNQLNSLFGKIQKTLNTAINKREMEFLAKEAIVIIVKRTRLGYGVRKNLGQREKLAPLSKGYIKQRKDFRALSGLTRAARSNLTRTGQLLDSMKITSSRDGKVIIGPQGRRNDGEKNENIAGYQADQGRIFNKVSLKEFNQIQRIYRKQFGDLLRKKRLIR